MLSVVADVLVIAWSVVLVVACVLEYKKNTIQKNKKK